MRKTMQVFSIVSILAFALILAPSFAGAGVYVNKDVGFKFTYPDDFEDTGEAEGLTVLNLKPTSGKAVPDISIYVMPADGPAKMARTALEEFGGVNIELISKEGNQGIARFEYMERFDVQSLCVFEKKGDKGIVLVFSIMEAKWDGVVERFKKMAAGLQVD